MNEFSEYILFLDETGNHGMSNIDDNYPIFGLCASLFHRADYCEQAIAGINQIKLNFFQHEGIHFHSTAIRRSEGPFRILLNPVVRMAFLGELSGLMSDLRLTLFFVALNKKEHARANSSPAHPYHYAMEVLLEQLQQYCVDKMIERLPIVAESRGESEDQTLFAEFERIIKRGRTNICGDHLYQTGFSLEFARKQHNVAGLQIADLMAYPLGRWMIDRRETEPARIALSKIHTIDGKLTGLKIIT